MANVNRRVARVDQMVIAAQTIAKKLFISAKLKKKPRANAKDYFLDSESVVIRGDLTTFFSSPKLVEL